MSKRWLVLFAATVVVMALLGSAGASGASAGPAPTPTPPAPGSPLARIVELLDDINAGNIAAVYAALTPEVQQGITQAQLQSALDAFQEGAGPIHITITSVGFSTQSGDQAEIELTLRVQAGSSLDVTLQEVATLVRIEGEWRLGDHFIQTALTALGLYRPGPLVRTFDARGCTSGDVLEGVYASARLHVFDPCVTATGVVHNVEHSTDGDITFDLAVPPEQRYLLNTGNAPGLLVVEIIPGDQQRVATPNEGDQVRVTGPWVNDTIHGHNEIHPAWSIERLVPLPTPTVSASASLPVSGSGHAGGGVSPLVALLAAAGLALLLVSAWLLRPTVGRGLTSRGDKIRRPAARGMP